MGHGSDKLYITHSEHAGGLGQHSASAGFRGKSQAPHPGNRTPFDCCSLSFQPFTHPVCARNSDGTGVVFDLVNIIPWLKQHKNTNPVTGESLEPKDLITLHYHYKASGQMHDPISFKPFSEHSHIVAIATTGNVFLVDSITSGKDLLTDTAFKKSDVITLQNPHGMPSASVASTSAAASSKSKAVAVKPTPPAAVMKTKATLPWNVSPYSTGMPGASLTSTTVDPTAQPSRLVWDEEELMFEAISTPPPGKGKEKDVGKRRAYVRVVTSLGGSLNLELFCEKAPKTCYNFLMLAREGKYNNCLFHRLIPGFMIQTGDPTGTGSGGESFWGTPFRDEYDLKGAAKHDSRGVLAMANKGAATNGSQFYITFKEASHLDRKHTVFGKLVGGEEVLDALEKLTLKAGTDRPSKSVTITEVVIYQDPFEDYKARLAKKHARQAEAEQNPNGKVQPAVATEKKEDMNWFGVKLGTGDSVSGKGNAARIGAGVGVGKYLELKRPRESSVVVGNVNGVRAGVEEDDSKKRRKVGFGGFDTW